MEFEDRGGALNGVGVADDAFAALAVLWIRWRRFRCGSCVSRARHDGRAVARAEARVQAVQVAVLAEAVGRGVPGQRGAKSAGVWFRRHAAAPAQAAARPCWLRT